MSQNEPGFNLRETEPPSTQHSAYLGVTNLGEAGRRSKAMVPLGLQPTRRRLFRRLRRVRWNTWIIPSLRSGARRARVGLSNNRHLSHHVGVHHQQCRKRLWGCEGRQLADAPQSWRSRRSSPRPGKPVTWRRAAVRLDFFANASSNSAWGDPYGN